MGIHFILIIFFGIHLNSDMFLGFSFLLVLLSNYFPPYNSGIMLINYVFPSSLNNLSNLQSRSYILAVSNFIVVVKCTDDGMTFTEVQY